MEMIPISALKEISGYRTRKSLAKWVRTFLGIELHHVGKNWCVIREEYEEAIRLRYKSHDMITKPERTYVPKSAAEGKFLSDLEDLLSAEQEL